MIIIIIILKQYCVVWGVLGVIWPLETASDKIQGVLVALVTLA